MSVCPRCTHAAPGGARFCPACGGRLATAEPARFASPEAYTPAHLAQRILDTRTAVEGERKQVTVLFADLQGLVDVIADHDPEEIGPIIDRMRELMMEAVHRYEGTVNQVVGDGIMALFGAPLANEDHAVRACYAALRMQARATALGDELQRSLGLPLQIRIGLNSGEVVVRSIGRDLSLTYTAVGQTVHLAARMEQMAKPASILATETTVGLARGRVAARALGPVPVRGLQAPVEVHEITGAVPIRSRLDTAAAGRPRSPLIGRERELARLDGTLDALLAGTGQIVSMVGEAGVGKSRLCLEFARRCRTRGCLVIEAPAVSYGRAAGYRPGVELHRRYFHVEAGDDPATIREKVATRFRALDLELEDGVSAILWVLGVPQDGGFGGMDPALRRRQVMRTVHRLVARQGRVQPFVMILEDMQWVDSETQAAMSALVETLPPYTLLAATSRPEYTNPWWRHPSFTEVPVDALEAPATEGLLDALLGSGPGLASLKRLLAERTDGNPLFLEECVASLVETGALVGEPGAYRFTRPTLTLEMPATVRATIAVRIDRLRYEDKRLLQAASVIGDEVPARLLEAIADAPGEEVRHGLDRLQTAGLLDQRALFPDLVYGFRHALVHDVAYESLLHERRRTLHASILEAIERSDEGRRVEQTERLAHHAFLGEVWDRAVGYCRQAGARTLQRMASWESVSFFERALAALAHRPAGAVERGLGVDLRCDLHNALVPLGQHARSVAVLREAAGLAELLGDQPRLARALSFESNVHWEMGASDEAARVGERALAIAERTRDLGLQVVGNYNVGAGRRALGDYRQALVVLQRNLTLLPPSASGETFGLPGIAAVLTRAHLAWTLAELGQFDDAIRVAEEGVRLAEARRDTYSLTYALLGLGGSLVRRGQLWEAKGILERGIALCADMPAFYPPFAGDLAVVYALTGRLEDALELAERGVRQAQTMQRLGRLSLLVTHLAEVRLLTGQTEGAEAEGRRALELAEAHHERGNMVYAHRLLGLATGEGRPPDPERARAHYAMGLALAEELGMRPLAARCRLGLGRLARRAGQLAEMETHLTAAREQFQAMGMTFWLERMVLDRVSPEVPGPSAI
jgi:class 3 adenylate cyclase/tetratricopeptide (TPR) repeat protein